ncbi:hypothetical protein HPP92_005526 [Vanilla planifolia]|uniref:Protein kinase domain-containing protein n=1 Tax=Vanilla planifolia TaxID=51239 RepID=A0A835RYU0_VANPL|nr:hypothetical protein HPP92_005526 [Vanilla planifolia]
MRNTNFCIKLPGSTTLHPTTISLYRQLVSNFNVSGEISWRNLINNSSSTSLVKEYFLNVNSYELLIEFLPSSGSFAFVNAIEVIPVPDAIFLGFVRKVGNSGFVAPLGVGGHGLETMYRLNVGGPVISPSFDQLLWTKWETDERYMFSVNAASTMTNISNISYVSPNDSFFAPLLVYETARTMINNEVAEKRFNLSWRFEVDPNFEYLVRLHFCELYYDKPNQRDFRIYINNKTAADDYDVFVKAGGMNKAYHEDYVDAMSMQIDTLWVQLGPDTLASTPGTDALLNGLEIFKLSHNANLAHGPDKINGDEPGAAYKRHKSKSFLAAFSAGFAALITISLASAALFFFKRRNVANQEKPLGWHPLSLHEMMGSTAKARLAKLPLISTSSTPCNRIGRRFSLGEIRAATANFDQSLVIGSGGFGKVYKGEIGNGFLVAIKRANPFSKQGLTEFETEVDLLSKLRHRHLVSMIGYCEEENEMILVYEYMANGTLRSHLYGSDLPSLSWKQRVEVCIGAARGLHYLHTGAETCIIHRDVKTTNILLDENLVAKIADFGLSKPGPTLDHTHVSTAVKGSFGYLDPEYYRKQQLTHKSDVYSFGVVLFEVICSRPVINPTLPKDQINLAEWALRWQRQRSLQSIVDPRLDGDYSLESLRKFGEIAEKCLSDEGRNRPTIGEVLWHLEYVLQLHEDYIQCQVDNSCTKSSLPFADFSFILPDTNKVQGETSSNAEGETISSLQGRSVQSLFY